MTHTSPPLGTVSTGAAVGLLGAFVAAIALPAPAQARELSTYETVVVGTAVGTCLIVEGFASAAQARAETFGWLASRGIEKQRVLNIMKINPKTFRQRVNQRISAMGGCTQFMKDSPPRPPMSPAFSANGGVH